MQHEVVPQFHRWCETGASHVYNPADEAIVKGFLHLFVSYTYWPRLVKVTQKYIESTAFCFIEYQHWNGAPNALSMPKNARLKATIYLSNRGGGINNNNYYSNCSKNDAYVHQVNLNCVLPEVPSCFGR